MLYDVIEGLCIRTGLPKPKVYIVDDPAPNAFAFGRSPRTSGVAVTTGLLNLMSRRELEGVLAHEMSHIRNRDVQVTTLAVTTVGILVAVAEIAARASWFADWGDDNDDGAIVLIAIAALAGVLAFGRAHPLARDLPPPRGARRRERGRARLPRRHPQGAREARSRPHRRAPRVACDRAPLARRAAAQQGRRPARQAQPDVRLAPAARRAHRDPAQARRPRPRTAAVRSTRRSPAFPSICTRISQSADVRTAHAAHRRRWR